MLSIVASGEISSDRRAYIENVDFLPKNVRLLGYRANGAGLARQLASGLPARCVGANGWLFA